MSRSPAAPRARRAWRAALRAWALVACVPAAALAQPATHLVAPGDTLTALARRYGTTVADLRAANALSGDLLRVGDRLALPAPPGWRTVRAPDGAGWPALAEGSGVDEATLRAANPDLTAPGGRVVRVPPASGALAWPRPGEDLVAFAARLGVAPGALAARNGLRAPYGVEPGAPLLLPASAAGPAGPATSAADRRDGARGTAADAGAPPAYDGVGGGADGEAPAALAAPVAAAGAATAPLAASAPRAAHDALRRAALARLPAVFEDRTLTPPDDGFAWPLAASPRITSSFGWRAISVAGNRFHQGLDLGAAAGTPVRAAGDGVVTRAGWVGAYGFVVYLAHEGGFETRYAHLSVLSVGVGERVRRGDEVGRVGSSGASTGPHLHFEARLAGRALDPLEVLPPSP